MSYLIRTGTGRNNISYGGGKSTKAKYLRRTGSGRTNISWIDINSNGTYNVLERTGNSRNNIRWYNITIRQSSSVSTDYYQSYRSWKFQTSGTYNGLIRCPSSGSQQMNSERESTNTRLDFTFTDSNSKANTFNTYLNTCPKLRFVQCESTESTVRGDSTVSTNHYVRGGSYTDVVRVEASSIYAGATWGTRQAIFFFGFTN